MVVEFFEVVVGGSSRWLYVVLGRRSRTTAPLKFGNA